MVARTVVVGLLFCCLALQADSQAVRKPGKKLWWASLAALAGASALDAHSSWGKPERNAMLRGPDGRFGPRGLQLKLVILGTSGAMQWLLLRRKPDLRSTVAGANAGLAAWNAAAAVKNYR